ncbi:MAG: YraN family protein [Gammaproteobacteria bacterium]
MNTPTETTNRRQARGALGERMARQYLESRGLRCLDSGWRCRLGELDLVMIDEDVIAFVEVRARGRGSLVSPQESVDRHKKRRVIQAARHWLMHHPREAELPARFDVVAIEDDGGRIDWIRSAFDADGR